MIVLRNIGGVVFSQGSHLTFTPQGGIIFLLYMVITVGGITSGMYFFQIKPESEATENLILMLIKKHIPKDLTDLPVVEEETEYFASQRVKDPIGLRILELKKYQE